MFTLKADLGRIDLMTESRDWDRSRKFGRNPVEAELYGRRVRTLSLPDLIKAKRAAGRVKDLQVLPGLESILEP